MSNIVLFDAVGTIIETVPSVIEAYHRHGQSHGSTLDAAEISRRFKLARQKFFDLDTSAQELVSGQLVSSDAIELNLWRQLIAEIFTDVDPVEPLFISLWDFFADAANWRVFDDTADCFARLKTAGYQIGIASNFDSRLLGIVSAFAELADADFVFCSAEIGFRKPDPAFYQSVQRRIESHVGDSVLGSIVMTGDCVENDFHGPRRHGWEALWLDRSGSRDTPVGCPAELKITSLGELADQLTKNV